MAERYSLSSDPERLALRFGLDSAGAAGPRFNIAPGQDAPVILGGARRELALMRWGLVPSWAEDPSVGSGLASARAETLAERPAFRAAYRSRRCLVPADGIYAWRRSGRSRGPLRFTLMSGALFPMAGLWESWRAPDGCELRSFAIATTAANRLLKPFADRMPLILTPEAEALWLDPAADLAFIAALFEPYPAEAMTSREASPLVNSPRNDGPDCLLPAEAALSRQGELF